MKGTHGVDANWEGQWREGSRRGELGLDTQGLVPV